MKDKEIILKVLLWSECILSARLLMFTVPVLIEKYARGEFALIRESDWTVWVLSLIGLFYFFTGLASLMGMRGWKFFHVLGFVITLVLSIGLINRIGSVSAQISVAYFAPLAVSGLYTLAILFSGATKKVLAH